MLPQFVMTFPTRSNTTFLCVAVFGCVTFYSPVTLNKIIVRGGDKSSVDVAEFCQKTSQSPIWCNDLTSISTVSCSVTIYLSGCSVPGPDRSKQDVQHMSQCSSEHFKLYEARTSGSCQENVRKLLSQTSVTLDIDWTLFPCI